jgi:hypothetical protein
MPEIPASEIGDQPVQPMNGMPQAPQGPKAGQDSFFKKKWVWAVGAVLVIVAFAAGAASKSGETVAAPSASAPIAAVAPAPVVTVTATPDPSSPTAAAVDPAPAALAVMPDVVCQNLQDAQDEIQRAGVFFSRSDDASGQARSQVIDRNWVVVAQTPAAGESVGEMEAILSVVKTDEPNNC